MAGSKNDRRAKDKSMAAYLKKHYVIRTTTACPHCHKSVGLWPFLFNHMVSCRGSRRTDKRKQSVFS